MVLTGQCLVRLVSPANVSLSGEEGGKKCLYVMNIKHSAKLQGFKIVTLLSQDNITSEDVVSGGSLLIPSPQKHFLDLKALFL